jgi:guanylate kinase
MNGFGASPFGRAAHSRPHEERPCDIDAAVPPASPDDAHRHVCRDAHRMSRRGILFVMTGASGVGKDTIRQAALPELDNLFFSISATTRAKRPGETHGKQYYFYDKPTFERLLVEDGLLEHAEYVGDYYGTPVGPVEEALLSGQDVLLELELVGARQVKAKRPEAVMIFIAPPTLVELERRLRGRGTDSEEKIQKRLARARAEIRAVREFEYVVVNDMLSSAADTFCSIIKAERARSRHLSEQEIARFLKEL